jgi:GNAT superfamily N-acetyltransferase
MLRTANLSISSGIEKGSIEYEPFKEWLTPIRGRAFISHESEREVKLGGSFGLLVRRDHIAASFFEAMEPPSPETMQLACDLFDRHGRLKDEIMYHPIRKGLGIWQGELSWGNFLIIESVSVMKSHRRGGVGRELVMDMIQKAMALNDDMRFIFAYPTCLHEGENLQDRAGMTKRERYEMARAQTTVAICFFRALGFRRVGLSDWFALSNKDTNHISRTITAESDIDPPEIEQSENDYDSDDSQPEVPKTRTFLHSESINQDGDFDYTEASLSSAMNAATAFVDNKRKRQDTRSKLMRNRPIHHSFMTLSDAECVEILLEQNQDNESRARLARMTDDQGNTLLHMAACHFMPNSTMWILNLAIEGWDAKECRNKQGYTPLEALQSKLENGRLGSYHGQRFIFQADQFDGYDEKATACLFALNGHTNETPEIMNRLRFGCSCGSCLGGFLSRRMIETLQLGAEGILRELGKTEHVQSHRVWYNLNRDLLENIPQNVRGMFKKSKVLRRGFRAFFITIIQCLEDSNIPTEENLMAVYRKSRLWPQMYAFYFAPGGRIDVATTLSLDFAKQQFRTTILRSHQSYGSQTSDLPPCRNDCEFELVKRQCLHGASAISSAQSSQVSINDRIK